VAKDIGNDNNLSAEEHPSIKIIKENKKEIPAYIIQQGSEIEELDLTNNKISYPLILY
jgi:hypothetical protein